MQRRYLDDYYITSKARSVSVALFSRLVYDYVASHSLRFKLLFGLNIFKVISTVYEQQSMMLKSAVFRVVLRYTSALSASMKDRIESKEHSFTQRVSAQSTNLIRISTFCIGVSSLTFVLSNLV